MSKVVSHERHLYTIVFEGSCKKMKGCLVLYSVFNNLYGYLTRNLQNSKIKIMTTKKNISDSQSKGMADNIFNNGVEANNKVADNNNESIPAEVNEAQTSHVPIEPKQQRIGAKQRKMEYGAYKTAFLAPKILEQRKQTSISKGLYNRIALMVRRLGDIDTTISGFIDSVLTQHMEDYAADHEAWRKL